MNEKTLNDLTVSELRFAAKLFGIDVPKNIKKTEIVDIFNNNGIDYERYIQESELQFTYKEADVKEEAEIEVIQQPETDKVVENTKSDSVILKMIHPRGALNVANKASLKHDLEYGFAKSQEETNKADKRMIKNLIKHSSPFEPVELINNLTV